MASIGGHAKKGGTAKLSRARYVAWLFLFTWQAACALSTDVRTADFRRTTWGPKEGAPGAVTALAQTSDGYLWLANSSGLTRFDGLRFEHIDLPRNERVSSANVWTLFAPESGGLWIGFTFGGVAFLKDGKLTAYTEQDGLPQGSVKAIAIDLNGIPWASTTTGLARLEGSRWEAVGPERGYRHAKMTALMVDSAGTLWSISKSRIFALRNAEKTFREIGSHPFDSEDVSIAESPTGEVWAGDGDRLVKLFKNENRPQRPAAAGMRFRFDRDGALWSLGSDGGRRRIARPGGLEDIAWNDVKAKAATYSEDLGSSAIGSNFSIIEDREGNVWSASAAGLIRYSERNVSRQPTAGLPEFIAYTAGMAAGDRGALWVVGREFPPFVLKDGNPIRRSEFGSVSCAFRADDGSLWFADKKSVWKFASGRIDRFLLPDGTDNFEVQAMTLGPNGDLWVSVVRKGVFRLRAGVWSAYGGIDALPRLPAITLASDAMGRVWFGYTDGRAAVLDRQRVTLFSEQMRLPVGNVTAVYGERSRVWAGGEFGLVVLQGSSFRAVTLATGTALTSVTGIIETAQGDLWVNSSAGIVHLPAAETRALMHDASYRPRPEIFGAVDEVEGSPARLRPLPSAVEGTDGLLWFLTDAGLYSVDPSRLRRNPVPPPVVIESLAVGDRGYEPVAGVELEKGTTSVRIRYVGLSLTMAEKVRYRYQLQGVDAGWQEAQGRREAFYTNLGPGRHRFRVIAANNDGVWNEDGATVDFVIPPTFVQTGWFIALCTAAAALGVWLLLWLRVRQVATQMRGRFAVRMAERERIARELHDTLLQSTQGLILRFQAVANRIAPDDPTRELLDAALGRADAVMSEGRDRVLDLRVSEDPSGDLPEALAATGEELAQGRAVTFRAVVEGTPHRLQPVAKDEIYCIGREALLNAFRHSQASLIELQIVYADDSLRLHVRDDGTGVDTNALEPGSRPGHWGVQGMRERAKGLGAQLEIWSKTGAGTEIELRVPGKEIYRHRTMHSVWRPLRRMAGNQP